MGARPPVLGLLAVLLLAVLATVWIVLPGPARPDDAAGGEVDGARYRLTTQASWRDRAPRLPDPAPLAFTGRTAAADRDAIGAVLTATRPEAHRLLDLVSAVVEVDVDRIPGEAWATTRSQAGGLQLRLDLRQVEALGPRAVRRAVLHGFGHALDHALVPGDVERAADRLAPRSADCGHEPRSCGRGERFAEAFARWASGDAADVEGMPVVPAPPESWGAVLLRLR